MPLLKMIKNSYPIALALVLLLSAIGARAEFPQATTEGRIDSIDFSSLTVRISGLNYQLAPDLTVEIGGSYGAFTMLKAGMIVDVEYRKVSNTERRIFLLRQLPRSHTLSES